MKYSFTMLKRFIAIKDNPDTLADHLITKTVEIEDIMKRHIPDSIVIGQITEITKHPDANKLNICIVDCGEKGTFQIVCGGVNVAVGIFVPVALTGTYFEAAKLKIEPRKMRGVESNGMICAKVELGIQEDLDIHGIWNMGEDFDDLSRDDLGKPLVEKYEWLENIVLDADNKGLTHRPDLTGHFGLATELQAIYNYHNPSAIKFNRLAHYFDIFKQATILDILNSSDKAEKKVICQTDKLNTYIALAIKNIQVKKSDFFTRLSLLDIGSNPINNWVDFSNLFMNISGQPIHFFDADIIKGNIIIRNAKKGEKFIDLFEKEYNLQEDDIVIADEEKILALGGVVGGLTSGVTEKTTNIIAEIANFDPVAVRKTGVRLGLRTDAELRFEKEISPLYSLLVLHLFLDQLQFFKKDLGNFDIKGLSYFIKDGVYSNTTSLEMDPATTAQFIYGEEKPDFDKNITTALEGLGFSITPAGEHLRITVPAWRSPADITIPADIYEEVARIIGYDSISAKSLQQDMEPTAYPRNIELTRTLESFLVQQCGYNQVETYPWIGDKHIEQFNLHIDKLYHIQNPIDTQYPYLRNSLVYGLLNTISRNSKFFDTIKVFDIGKIWNTTTQEQKKDSRYAVNLIGEVTGLGMMIYKKKVTSWQKDSLLDIKGEVSALIDHIGLQGKLSFKLTEHSFAHPKKQGTILFNMQKIGSIYTLHPLINQDYKIDEKSQISYVELSLPTLVALQEKIKTKVGIYETLQDQIIWRDLCFVINKEESFQKIIESLQSLRAISDVEIFDIYEGEHLPEGKKSLAVKIKIKGENMTADDINEIMQTAIKKVESTGAQLRG